MTAKSGTRQCPSRIVGIDEAGTFDWIFGGGDAPGSRVSAIIRRFSSLESVSPAVLENGRTIAQHPLPYRRPSPEGYESDNGRSPAPGDFVDALRVGPESDRH
jgi:hypothetical protein